MALKDKIPFGMVLPHRSPDPVDMQVVHRVAQRAEALGFRDLWVTENTLDHVFCFDPMVILTYAAAVTTTIRVGVSVVVLPVHNPMHVAHQVATLDYVSHGRAILGVGLGREAHYTEFQYPESAVCGDSAKAWSSSKRCGPSQRSTIRVRSSSWKAAPWLPSQCRSRIRRSGWAARTPMPCAAPRPSPTAGWAPAARARPISRTVSPSCGQRWRRPGATQQPSPSRNGCSCPCMSVQRWPAPSSTAGSAWSITILTARMRLGSTARPSRCESDWKRLVAMGANHLLLNPVCRHVEQLDALAAVVGLS